MNSLKNKSKSELIEEIAALKKKCQDYEKIVIEHKQAEIERSVFQRLTQRLTYPLHPNELGKIIAEEAYQLFHYDAFSLDVINKSIEMLTCIYNEDTAEGEKKPKEMPPLSIPIKVVKNKDVLRGKSKLINRRNKPANSTLYSYGVETQLSMSLMFVPLKYENKTIGIMTCQSYTASRYQDNDLDLFQIFANHAGGALVRSQIETELRENEEKLRNIFENSTNLFYSHTPAHELTYLSPQVKDILGYTPEEALVKWTEFASDNPINKKGFEYTVKAIETGKPQPPYELELIRKNGQKVWVEVREAPVVKGRKTIAIVGALTDITERKQAEEALKQSEQKFRRLFEEIPDAIFMTRIGGKNAGQILDANPIAEKQTGYSRNELIGMNILRDFSRQKISKNLTEERENRLQKGESVLFTEKKYRKDGSEYWTEVLITIIEYENEKITLSVNRDITKQKKTEEEMRIVQFSINHSKDAMYLMGRDARFVNVSDSACKALGYSKEELLTMKVHDINPEFTAEVWPAHWADLQKRGSFVIHTTHQRKDKTTFPVEITVNYIKFEEKEYNCAFAKDITERILAEKALKSSEERFKIIFESAPDAYYINDLNGNIIDGNQAAEELLGYQREELIGKNYLQLNLLSPKDYLKAAKGLAKNLQGKGIGPDEFALIRKDGSTVVAEIRTFPVKIEDKTVVLGIARDISERKRVEEELREHRDHLEELVKQRTAEVEEKAFNLQRSQEAMRFLLEDVNAARRELEKTNIDLLDANKELESFSYSISHDLRAPLRAILGFSNKLGNIYANQLDNEGKRIIKVIGDNTKKMGQLIDDLLAFSRMGRLPLKKTEFSMKKLVQEMCTDLKKTNPDRHLKFTIYKLVDVVGDASMLRQALLNLLSNATKFTKYKKQAMIEIGCHSKKKEIIYYVKDNGVGFDMNYTDKLFKVFQRLHSEKEFEGTGVGLAIVQRIIHRHGGRVWAESELNKGATFYFTLPKESTKKITGGKVSTT